MPDIVTNVLYQEIDRLQEKVKEQDEVYDALSVSFDALRKKYHDLAHDFFHKNAALVAANHRVKELEEENRYLRAGCQDETHQCPIVGTNNTLIERIAELEAERDADRRREYGYSQQTVDALTAERDKLTARVKELEESRDSWKREWRLSNAGLDMAEKRIAELEAEMREIGVGE